MPKVREVFALAYGLIPEGATCHVGHWGGPGMGWQMEPTIINRMRGASWPEALRRRQYGNEPTYEFEVGPDISDRDAEAFRGFFGEDYDAALEELKKEQYWREVEEAEDAACGMFAGGLLADLGMLKEFPHASPNGGEDDAGNLAEVNKLLDAMGVLRANQTQPDPRRVIALADAMVDNPIYRTSYMEASREFWAALSADGTGESPVLSTHLDVMGVASQQGPDMRHNQPSVSQESSNE